MYTKRYKPNWPQMVEAIAKLVKQNKIKLTLNNSMNDGLAS